ncbi:MAG TPA: CPBP family intramembrane glutamic endopeptidase [Candidatus Acidoferrum sp.]|nr:CPBP family intramembrane glutamic endopeptidase [Candidatus Acidoferrum sp.]
MAGERLSGSEKRALLLWVALGIIGTIFGYKYFFRAFPEASVDFRVTRGEALKRAQSFVAGLGENVSGYRSAIVFSVDDDSKTYLERELGLQQANQLMSSQLHVWYWDVRFFRPLQEEEFYVRVSPAGNIVGYTHKIEEARPGATLDRATAQDRAQNFLVSKLGVDPNQWDFLPEEVNSIKRPNRTDWSFTWEKHAFRAKDAPYRLTVALEGERIGGSREYLRVPEAWERSFQRLRSANDTLALVFTVPYILLLGVAVWLAFKLTSAGQSSWRGAIVLGFLVAGLLFLQNLNDWPLWSASYNTNASYTGFLLAKIGTAALVSLLTALTVTLVLPAAEPLYRASQPQRLQLSKAFTLRGLRTKEFFSAAVVGLSMAAAHIGYVVVFYVVAQRYFGAWAPQEINYQDSVNTLFPWLAGAAIGLLASTNEEFTFRLFAIPFFQRLTGSRWIAVVLPAFMWSFLHSNYPQEPPYIRGIEIGIFGIIAGLVMLRWGILATLIWHYTVDASLVGLLLIRSNSLYFKISGIVVGLAAAAPLLFAGISYLSRGRFEPDEDLQNQAAPAPEISLATAREEIATRALTRRYDALSPAMLAFLAVCLVAGGSLAWKLKPESIGDYLRLSVNGRSARAHADAIFRQCGLQPHSYLHATLLVNVTDPVTNEFLRERVGVARLNDILATQVPGALWRVRYFRDSQPEEYAVVLKPDGSLHAVRHTLADEAPGASLSKEEAVGRAEKFLREEKKIDLSQWSLVESTSDKRPHRIDHTLTWQQNTPLDGGAPSSPAVAKANTADHAFARMEVVVLGDEVTNFRTYIKIPDEWRRKHEELTLAKIVFGYAIPILVVAGFAITALIVFLKNLRSEVGRTIPWKRLTRWALWGLAGYVLAITFGDFVQNALGNYRTAIPFKVMIGVTAISALLGILFSFGFLALLFGAAWYYGKQAFGEERIPEWTGMPGAYYRDAVFIGLGGIAGCVGLDAISKWVYQHLPGVQGVAAAAFGANLDAVFPAAAILGSGVRSGLTLTALVCITAGFIVSMIRPKWLRISVFVLAVFALGGFSANWHDPIDVAKKMVIAAVWIGVIDVAVRHVIRFNVLGYFLIFAGIALLAGAGEMLRHPDYFYRANGYGILAALMVLFGWPLVAWRQRDKESA